MENWKNLNLEFGKIKMTESLIYYNIFNVDCLNKNPITQKEAKRLFIDSVTVIYNNLVIDKYEVQIVQKWGKKHFFCWFKNINFTFKNHNLRIWCTTYNFVSKFKNIQPIYTKTVASKQSRYQIYFFLFVEYIFGKITLC